MLPWSLMPMPVYVTFPISESVTLSLVEYLTVGYSTFKTFEKAIITTNLISPQTSKQTYRKSKYREKVFEEFQRLPRFPRKMVLYSSTKFGILKSWTNIPKLIRFDFSFWQSSKQIYRKLVCREKVFGEFQRLSRFPRKMVLYSSTEFGILKSWTNIPKLIRFDFSFWQTSKQIYRKLVYRENVFGEGKGIGRLTDCQTSKQIYKKLKYKDKLFREFQCLLRFPRKVVLYSSTKFYILKTWTNIS